MKGILPPLGVLAGFLLLWQAAVMFFGTKSWILPSPLAIFREGRVSYSRLFDNLESTLGITLLGFAIGSLVGVVVACVLHAVPGIKAGFYPLLIMTQNIPTIVLAPLLVIWFGFGLLPKMILITLVCFFPVSVALLGGFARTDAAMLDYFRMSGASRMQQFFKLEFPHALPSLFSGLKISATYSVMGAVIAEWMGAEKGIGVLMMSAKATYRSDRMFVSIFAVIIASMLLFSLVALAEKLIVRSSASREEERR